MIFIDFIKQNLCICLRKALFPDVFKNMSLLTGNIHCHTTRSCNAFYMFPCRTNIRQFGIRLQGPKLFNSLNIEIQNADSIFLFKSKFRTSLQN